MTAALTAECPGAVAAARGVSQDQGGPMHDDSTPVDREREYSALIKPGDAIATPDDAVWVVERVAGEALEVIAASRGVGDELIYVDPYEQVKTSVPTALARKIADARSVRRP